MRQIEVMQVGSPVMLSGDIPARITSIWIEDKCRIQYQCAWWEGRTRRCEWIEQFEVVRTDETQGMKIGFRDDAA